MSPPQNTLVELSPEDVEQWLAEGDTVLLDVREEFEHAAERINAAISTPLSKLDPESIRTQHLNSRVIFHCRSGKRSADAAARCQLNGESVFHLAGGIENWKASGREVLRSESAPKLPVMQQVQIAAGLLVLTGVILGAAVSPWFLVISGFVGTGLLFAGTTGWCGMAMLLASMPWNRR